MPNLIEYTHQEVQDFPDEYTPRVVYLVGDIGKKDYWYANMVCPCGCGSTIMLNLIDDVRPLWKVRFSSGELSIYPSIWRTDGCKSHFWIRDGKLLWAEPKPSTHATPLEDSVKPVKKQSSIARLWKWIKGLWRKRK